LTTTQQLEAVLQKQALSPGAAKPFGRYLLGKVVSGPAKAWRGMGEFMQDVGRTGGKVQAAGKRVGGAGKWMDDAGAAADDYAKQLDDAVRWKKFAPNLPLVGGRNVPGSAMGQGAYWKGLGAKTMGAAAQWAPWMLPGAAAAFPVWHTLQNVGNMGGQALALAGGRGKQMAMDGANSTVSQLYQELESRPYAERRQLLNDPSVLQSITEQSAPNAVRFMPGAPKASPSWWEAIKQLLPTGQGDLTPIMRQKAIEASRAQMANMVKGANAGGAVAKQVGKSLLTRLGDRTIRSANKWVKWPSRVGAYTAAAAPLPLAIGGAMGYLGAGQAAGQIGTEATLAGAQQMLSSMPAWQRELIAMDPSLLMSAANRKMPGLASTYQQQTGAPFKPGMLGQLFDLGQANQWGYNTGGGFKNV